MGARRCMHDQLLAMTCCLHDLLHAAGCCLHVTRWWCHSKMVATAPLVIGLYHYSLDCTISHWIVPLVIGLYVAFQP